MSDREGRGGHSVTKEGTMTRKKRNRGVKVDVGMGWLTVGIHVPPTETGEWVHVCCCGDVFREGEYQSKRKQRQAEQLHAARCRQYRAKLALLAG